MKTNTAVQICSICGMREATTMDHIPPKSIYTDPTSDLITVPACAVCNNSASIIDERFKVHLGLQVSTADEIGIRLFQEATLPTLEHNRKLLNQILSSLKPMRLVTKSGIIIGHEIGGKWDSEHKSHYSDNEDCSVFLYYSHFLHDVMGGPTRRAPIHRYG